MELQKLAFVYIYIYIITCICGKSEKSVLIPPVILPPTLLNPQFEPDIPALRIKPNYHTVRADLFSQEGTYDIAIDTDTDSTEYDDNITSTTQRVTSDNETVNETSNITPLTIDAVASTKSHYKNNDICLYMVAHKGVQDYNCVRTCQALYRGSRLNIKQFGRNCSIDLEKVYEFEFETNLNYFIPYLPKNLKITPRPPLIVSSMIECSLHCKLNKCIIAVISKSKGYTYKCYFVNDDTNLPYTNPEKCQGEYIANITKKSGFCGVPLSEYKLVYPWKGPIHVLDGNFNTAEDTQTKLAGVMGRNRSLTYETRVRTDVEEVNGVNEIDVSVEPTESENEESEVVTGADIVMITASASMGIVAGAGALLGGYFFNKTKNNPNMDHLYNDHVHHEIIDLSINTFA